MKHLKVAINGFGRIGRTAFQSIAGKANLDLVAINDLGDLDNLAYLLKYDSVYGHYPKEIQVIESKLKVGDKEYLYLNEPDPIKLPWKKLDIDVILECSGVFTEKGEAEKHLTAGAKRVIISAPSKSEEIATYIMGVNHQDFKIKEDLIISNASCTTNALAPIMKVLVDQFGVAKSLMTTVHSYTATQNLVDGPVKSDFRRGRAGALNLSPSTTGAAKTTVRIIPTLKDKFDGLAVRVPTPCVSLVDLTALLSRNINLDELKQSFINAAQRELKGILAVTNEPLVSNDFIRDPHSVIVDLPMTQIVDGNLVKVLGWYDNEWGYALRLVEMAEYIGSKI